MTRRTAFGLLVLLIAGAPAAVAAIQRRPDGNTDNRKPVAAKKPVTVDASRIAAEIEKLGSPSYQQRKDAERALRAIGPAALKQLRTATASNDAEIAKRAKAILGDLEEQQFLAQASKLGFDKILDRIHQHASADKWRKPGWKDPGLEAALKTFIHQVKRVTGNNAVKLPVRLADVRAGADLNRIANRNLFIVKGGEVGIARDCIFLVDGSIRISSARNCVIIARHAVEISSGRGNVVLAGHYIRASTSGRDGAPSILMSGSDLNVSIATNAVLSAPGNLRVSIARNTVLVNSPNARISSNRNGTKIEKARILLAPRKTRQKNPLSDLVITQAFGYRTRSAVVIKQGPVELVLRAGSPITDNRGKVIPKYAGWKLTFVTGNYAVFSKGREDVGVHIK